MVDVSFFSFYLSVTLWYSDSSSFNWSHIFHPLLAIFNIAIFLSILTIHIEVGISFHVYDWIRFISINIPLNNFNCHFTLQLNDINIFFHVSISIKPNNIVQKWAHWHSNTFFSSVCLKNLFAVFENETFSFLFESSKLFRFFIWANEEEIFSEGIRFWFHPILYLVLIFVFINSDLITAYKLKLKN